MKILGPNDPALAALQKSIDLHPGQDIQLEIIPWEDYRTKLDETLGNYKYDAVFIPGHIWMPQLVVDGLIQPLDSYFSAAPKELVSQYDPDGIFASIQTECKYTPTGEKMGQYMLPLFTDGHIVFYRSDLVNLPEQVSPRDLPELINSFNLPAGMNGFAQKAHPSEILLDFLPYFWDCGGELVSENGEIKFNSELGEKALELYHRLKFFCPSDSENYGNSEIVNAITTGESAMAISWGGQAAAIFASINAGAGAEIKTASLTNAWNTTWGVSIPTNVPSARAQEVFEVLLSLMDGAGDELITQIAGSPVRTKSYSSEMKANYAWLGSQEELLKNCKNLPVDPNFSKYLGPLYAAVHDVYTEKKSPRVALEEAAKV